MEYKIDSDTTDSKLIYMVNENNEDAKDYLYKKYSPLIHKEINRISRDAFRCGIEYSDLTQEAMLAFSEAIRDYDDHLDVKFITFATLCIKRRLINLMRKYNTNKQKIINNQVYLDNSIDGYNESLKELISDKKGKEPLNKLITDESLKEVNQIMIDKLSLSEKKALIGSINGLSINDIAEQLNMTTKQVYNLIYRARKKITID